MTPPADCNVLPMNPRILMIVLAFAEGPAHGYEIKKRAAERFGGSVRLDAGSLYRSIAQLLDQGMIEEVSDAVDARRTDSRRRYYALTAKGRALAAAEATRLAGLVEYAALNGLIDGPKVVQ